MVKPMKTILATNAEAKLDRLTFVAFLFSGLSFLSLIKWWFDVTWPLATLPLGLALATAAFFYGGKAGTRGRQCGPSVKSWVLAWKMIWTTLVCVICVFAIALVFGDAVAPNFGYRAGLSIGLELVLCLAVSFVVCRYAFVAGVNRGYAAFLKQGNRNQ